MEKGKEMGMNKKENGIPFGKNLRRIAKQKEIRQYDIARYCGVTEATMSRYFNDKRIPNVIVTAKMANFMGVQVSELLKTDEVIDQEIKYYKYPYPAVFHYANDEITITFPDFENAITFARTDKEAIEMAKDLLELEKIYRKDMGIAMPKPSSAKVVLISSEE